MTEETDLEKAIQKLSQKSHLVSEEALRASELNEGGQDLIKQRYLISEFNRSIRILMGVFRDSNFDQMIVLISQPFRLFMINFLLGFIKGMGVAVGIISILIIVLFFFKEMLPATFFIQLHSFLTYLKQ